MRPLSREVLARENAARLTATRLLDTGGAACEGHGATWSELEQRHRTVCTEAEARELIEEIRTRFCGGCPLRLGCAQWAQTQEYTGLAAGAAYEKGTRMDASWVVRPGRRRRRAS